MAKVYCLVSVFVILSFIVCQSFQFPTKENSKFDIETLSRIDEALDRISPFDRVKRSPLPKRGGRRKNRLRNRGGDSSSEESSESSESNSMSSEEEEGPGMSSEEEEGPSTGATTDFTIEVFTLPTLPETDSRLQRQKRGFWSSEESSESSESESVESSEEVESATQGGATTLLPVIVG